MSPSREMLSSPVAAHAVRAALQRLRDQVRERLDRIETLARTQLAAPRSMAADSNDAHAAFRAEREAWERTRQAQLEELETNRRLLAEAWERLETERIEAAKRVVAGPAPAAAATQAQQQPPAPVARAPAVPVVRSAEIEKDDSVTRSIMREFQSLRRDVRRNSNSTPS
jgi:hypothetical protein